MNLIGFRCRIRLSLIFQLPATMSILKFSRPQISKVMTLSLRVPFINKAWKVLLLHFMFDLKLVYVVLRSNLRRFFDLMSKFYRFKSDSTSYFDLRLIYIVLKSNLRWFFDLKYKFYRFKSDSTSYFDLRLIFKGFKSDSTPYFDLRSLKWMTKSKCDD